MKTLLVAAMTAQLSTAFAVAAETITADNLQNLESNVVTDSSGARISVGGAIVSVGFFTEADANITDLSAYTQVGNTIGFLGNGFFQDDITTDLTELGLASTQSVYIVVGNNTSDIKLSTELLIFKTNETFTAGPPTAGPSTVNLYSTHGSIVNGVGELGTYSFDHDGAAPAGGLVDAYTMTTVTAVPEPSSVALLGLGAVAFAFRRRK